MKTDTKPVKPTNRPAQAQVMLAAGLFGRRMAQTDQRPRFVESELTDCAA